MLKNTVDSWGSVSKTFHWLTGLMIILQLAAGFAMAGFDFGSAKMRIYDLHKSTGVVIFMLVTFRLIWRLGSVVPAQPASVGNRHHYLERSGIFLLYFFMLAMPLSGFMMSDTSGRPITLYHLYTLPHLFSINPALSNYARMTHRYASFGFTSMLILHISAALYHHYGLQNNILRRMLPGNYGNPDLSRKSFLL